MYNLADLHASEQIPIASDSAIVFIVNNSPKYFNFLKQAVYNLQKLHRVNIYILCLQCSSDIKKILDNTENISILDIEFDDQTEYLKKEFLSQKHQFQYIKPFAIEFLVHYFLTQSININNILYLDVDTFPIRNINEVIDEISNGPLVVKELGIDYRTLGYENYLNNKDVYRYFNIPMSYAWSRNEPCVNTGVLGFDLRRDKKILSRWAQITITILKNEHLKSLVKWWDQGCFMLALESLGLKQIASNERRFNYTVLNQYIGRHSLSSVPANILHFIGDTKINLSKTISDNSIDIDFLEIAVAGHSKEQFERIHPRSYLKYAIMSELDYDNPLYKHNSIGESRIFLANNLFKDTSEVVGTATASWNRKYYPHKIDHIANWPFYPIIEKMRQDPTIVLCATLCYGSYAREGDPLWVSNFQKHFRKEFNNSDWVEDKLYKITGLKYDGIRPAPYANQIICHKTLFYELCQFIRKHMDTIIDSFSLTPTYETPDPSRPLAYILEELTMLWWSSRNNVQFVPTVHITPNWYKK